MKRLVQDLGDLTGLDIIVAARCAAPVRDAAMRSGQPPMSTALALGVLRWLGLALAAGGRRRSDADERAPHLH